MSERLIFCSDMARRDPSQRAIVRTEGWAFASTPIAGLFLCRSNRSLQQVPLGFARPDVGRAYPEFPTATRSGFRMSTEHDLHANAPSNFLLQIEASEGARQLHLVSLRLETRDVQTIELTAETQAQALPFAAVLSQDAEIETHFRHSLGQKPGLTLRLDIINKCNLRCVMCHFSDDAIFKRPTRQFTAEQFRDLFEDIGPSIGQVMLSCGDEPLTSKFLPEILRYLAAEHPHVAIEFCTNAMLMSAPMRELIMETRVARLLFSIDAVSKPLLESIRTGCRYEQLVGNIVALRDLKWQRHSPTPAFVFNFVMMNRNIHEAPAFVRMAHELGAEAIDFRHVVPILNYFQPEELLSEHPAKYNYYREKIAAEAQRLGVNCYLAQPFATVEQWTPVAEPPVSLSDFERVLAEHFTAAPNGEMTPAAPTFSWEGTVAEEFATTFCNRPFSEIMVRDQEEVLPCPWHAKPLGRLSEGKSLSEIFFGPEFARLRQNMLTPAGDPGCANCPIKSGHLPIDANV